MENNRSFVSFCFLFFLFFLPLGSDGHQEKATLAGGCFWCMQPPFDKLTGVLSTVVGYTGGFVVNPTYRLVSGGETGHLEAVLLTFDPSLIKYREILDVFWRNIDPADGGGQFCDRGEQYTSAIFYHSAKQQFEAKRSKQNLEVEMGFPFTTQIREAKDFFRAEISHQNFYLKNFSTYSFYREQCQRDARLSLLWGEREEKERREKRATGEKGGIKERQKREERGKRS